MNLTFFCSIVIVIFCYSNGFRSFIHNSLRKKYYESEIRRSSLQSIICDTIDISPHNDNGILKRIIRKGNENSGRPTDNDIVEVIWRLYGYSGDLIQNLSTPFKFRVGHKPMDVVPAWDLVVRTMNIGEIASITVKPEYGFGEEGI
jgi:hypothetical protein